MSDLTKLESLREPFPPAAVDKLPRGVEQGGRKTTCKVCGGYHAPASVHLDYVGHANVTHRLLDVDLEWNWEPLALDHEGLPAIRQRGNTAELWIRLTIGGVTRIGVGTTNAGKDEVSKELIGDAIRNASMRFGVALDLWSKGDAWVTQESRNDDAERQYIEAEAKAMFHAAGLTKAQAADAWNAAKAIEAESADEFIAVLQEQVNEIAGASPSAPLTGTAPAPPDDDDRKDTLSPSSEQPGSGDGTAETDSRRQLRGSDDPSPSSGLYTLAAKLQAPPSTKERTLVPLRDWCASVMAHLVAAELWDPGMVHEALTLYEIGALAEERSVKKLHQLVQHLRAKGSPLVAAAAEKAGVEL